MVGEKPANKIAFSKYLWIAGLVYVLGVASFSLAAGELARGARADISVTWLGWTELAFGIIFLFIGIGIYLRGETNTGHYQGVFVHFEKISDDARDFFLSIQFAWAVAGISWLFADLSAMIAINASITWVGWLGLGLAVGAVISSVSGIRRVLKRWK